MLERILMMRLRKVKNHRSSEKEEDTSSHLFLNIIAMLVICQVPPDEVY
jgi:hypothetical protein